MPDPTGTNLTDDEVSRIQFADPLFQQFKLADRLQEIRNDHEIGEVHDSMALTLTADHTLVEPGGDVGVDESEISSQYIFVTNAASRTLTLCDPTKFKGKLVIIHPSGNDNLIVAHTQNPITIGSSGARQLTVYSDGSNWYASAVEEEDCKDLTNA